LTTEAPDQTKLTGFHLSHLMISSMTAVFHMNGLVLALTKMLSLLLFQPKVYIKMKTNHVNGKPFSSSHGTKSEACTVVNGTSVVNKLNLQGSISFSTLKIQESLLKELLRLIKRESMLTLKSDTTSSLITCQLRSYLNLIQSRLVESSIWQQPRDSLSLDKTLTQQLSCMRLTKTLPEQ
jgi:hypothetical protein